MKEYNLSDYMLMDGNLVLFPLTKEEIMLLAENKAKFEEHLGLPYHAKGHSQQELENIARRVNMEDDLWFLKSQWVAVDSKAKKIVGRLTLDSDDQCNRISYHVSDGDCVSIQKNDVCGLFYRFLEVNGFKNITFFEVDGGECEDKQ